MSRKGSRARHVIRKPRKKNFKAWLLPRHSGWLILGILLGLTLLAAVLGYVIFHSRELETQKASASQDSITITVVSEETAPSTVLSHPPSTRSSHSIGQVLVTTDESFQKDVINSKVPVLIDFWATWCGPCRMYGQVVDEIASEYGEKLRVCRVNVDENPSLNQQFRITAIPASFIVKKGKVIKAWRGYAPLAVVQDQLNKALNVPPSTDFAGTRSN